MSLMIVSKSCPIFRLPSSRSLALWWHNLLFFLNAQILSRAFQSLMHGVQSQIGILLFYLSTKLDHKLIRYPIKSLYLFSLAVGCLYCIISFLPSLQKTFLNTQYMLIYRDKYILWFFTSVYVGQAEELFARFKKYHDLTKIVSTMKVLCFQPGGDGTCF